MADIEHRRYALVRNEYTLPASTSGEAVQRLLGVLGGDDATVDAAAALAAVLAHVRVEASADGIRFFTETVSEGPWPT